MFQSKIFIVVLVSHCKMLAIIVLVLCTLHSIQAVVKLEPPKNYARGSHNNCPDRQGQCALSLFKCGGVPFSFNISFIFECDYNCQCPKYYKCCKQECFTHKICLPLLPGTADRDEDDDDNEIGAGMSETDAVTEISSLPSTVSGSETGSDFVTNKYISTIPLDTSTESTISSTQAMITETDFTFMTFTTDLESSTITTNEVDATTPTSSEEDEDNYDFESGSDDVDESFDDEDLKTGSGIESVDAVSTPSISTQETTTEDDNFVMSTANSKMETLDIDSDSDDEIVTTKPSTINSDDEDFAESGSGANWEETSAPSISTNSATLEDDDDYADGSGMGPDEPVANLVTDTSISPRKTTKEEEIVYSVTPTPKLESSTQIISTEFYDAGLLSTEKTTTLDIFEDSSTKVFTTTSPEVSNDEIVDVFGSGSDSDLEDTSARSISIDPVAISEEVDADDGSGSGLGSGMESLDLNPIEPEVRSGKFQSFISPHRSDFDLEKSTKADTFVSIIDLEEASSQSVSTTTVPTNDDQYITIPANLEAITNTETSASTKTATLPIISSSRKAVTGFISALRDDKYLDNTNPFTVNVNDDSLIIPALREINITSSKKIESPSGVLNVAYYDDLIIPVSFKEVTANDEEEAVSTTAINKIKTKKPKRRRGNKGKKTSSKTTQTMELNFSLKKTTVYE